MEDRKLSAESPLSCVARSALLGTLFGASIGATECAKLLIQGVPRYAEQALRMVGVGCLGYALLGALLGTFCGVLAWILWRRPTFKAASASACAGLGTLLALAAFVLLAQVGAMALLPTALLGTLLALSLRELLAWVPLLVKPWPWACLAAILLSCGAVTFAVRGGATAGARTTAAVTKPRPNVLLVTIDTLRRDHLGCYGASDAKTPTIDSLAKESVQFLDATSQANTTGPSHATILSGLYPSDNGARSNAVPIANDVRTLPELLSEQGFSTAACVSGFTLVQSASGLAPRFEYYDDNLLAWHWLPEAALRLRLFAVAVQVAKHRGETPLRADRPANETIDSALGWLDARDPQRPFFLWTHLFDPHCPYNPPAPYDRMHDGAGEQVATRNWYKLTTSERRELIADPREVEHMRALYKGEISFVDHELARLLGRLRAQGTFDNTLVILAADHGEGLGEHGYWFDHGTYLYDSELSVPLLIHFPAAKDAGLQVTQQVRLLDITPTVLGVLGIETPKNLSGVSLVGELKQTQPTYRPSFAQGEVSGDLSGYELGGRKLSLRSHGRKLVWTSDWWLDSVRAPQAWELYDLARDPLEQSDIFEDAKKLPADGAGGQSFQSMRASLETWRDITAESASRTQLTPEVRARLRSLGY